MASFTAARLRQQHEAQAHRTLAARTVARMARDPHDEARLLAILDLTPA